VARLPGGEAGIEDGQDITSTITADDSEKGGRSTRLKWSDLPSLERRPYLEVIARQVWPTWKLLGDTEKDQEIFINKMCQLMNPDGFANPVDELAWKVKHGNACISAFNATRSNVVSQLKAQTETWWLHHDRKMPDLDKLQEIATRTVVLTPGGDAALGPNGNGEVEPFGNVMELFVWWWDSLLPAATAPSTTFWSQGKRWYNLIHDGKAGDKLLLTPQDEAFALLCMENYYTQWSNDFAAKADHPKYKLVKPKKKEFQMPTDPVSVARGYVIVDKKIIKFGDKKWKTKYTLSNAGSSLSGGWTTEGKKKYWKLMVHVNKGRKLPFTPAKEELVLNAVRIENGVSGDNYDQYLQAKKKAKTSRTVIEGFGLLEKGDEQEVDEDEVSAISANHLVAV